MGMRKFLIWILIIADIAAAVSGLIAGLKFKQRELASPVWIIAISAFVVAHVALAVLPCCINRDPSKAGGQFIDECCSSPPVFMWLAWLCCIVGAVFFVAARTGLVIILGGVSLGILDPLFAWLYTTNLYDFHHHRHHLMYSEIYKL
ncbi:unnamed protein product [Cuscuta europaea]|uniref:Uncharacterized protein n=1 Tax=Cuscuta europaea TaxID=41803 RepID=A0A9P0YLC0_CUSEU|nr:unnamed protein product [Cuscuta europaea]